MNALKEMPPLFPQIPKCFVEDAAAVEVRREERAAAIKNETAVPDHLPPPFYATFVAWIGAILTLEIGADIRPAIQDLHAACLEDTKIMMLYVGACKLETTGDQSKIRIVVAMAQLPERAAIITALSRVPAVHHAVGQAPAGWLEEELGDWAEFLRGAQTE